MTVGERIKAAREIKGATQEELARAANTTKQTIYKYENNIVSNIPSNRIEDIAMFLGVSESYLMGWEQTIDLNQSWENELLKCYRKLSPERANRVFQYAAALLEVQEAEAEISNRNNTDQEQS